MPKKAPAFLGTTLLRSLPAAVMTLMMMVFSAGHASAATIGSNLNASPNGAVCAFTSLEPETRACTVDQSSLTASHTATDGLTVPFDGVVTGWSVVSGAAPPGTGSVKLALRTTSGPGYLERGPEVDLPLAPAGTRHSFPESMKVSGGQHLGVKVIVTNGSPQEAGAPLAFMEPSIGVVDTWTHGDGEPMGGSSIWDTEENTELLFAATVEPDSDRDGLGDLSQDCFPNHPFDQELCGRDLRAPEIESRIRRHQKFLKSGFLVARVSSDEAGTARANSQLEIYGRHGVTVFQLRPVRTAVDPAAGSVALQIKIRKGPLRIARTAAREGRRIVVHVRVSVTDAAGLVAERRASVKPNVARGGRHRLQPLDRIQTANLASRAWASPPSEHGWP